MCIQPSLKINIFNCYSQYAYQMAFNLETILTYMNHDKYLQMQPWSVQHEDTSAGPHLMSSAAPILAPRGPLEILDLVRVVLVVFPGGNQVGEPDFQIITTISW